MWYFLAKIFFILLLFQDYESQLIIPEPNFSIEGFFIFLTCMMVVSLVAFIFLNCWPSFRHEYADTQLIVQNEENMNSSDQSTLNPDWPKIHKREFLFLLAIQCFVCFVSNGAFPSIQVPIIYCFDESSPTRHKQSFFIYHVP